MIEAGAAGVHFEDQLAVGEEVRPSRRQGARPDEPVRPHARRRAARGRRARRADRARRPHRRAQRHAAHERRRPGRRGVPHRRADGGGLLPRPRRARAAIARSLAYAPYADVLWFETSTPDLGEAREFAQAIHERFPGKLLAYNCSPSFNWKQAARRRRRSRGSRSELAALGYRFQFVTLAGFHALNASMFELAHGYAREGMTAYVRLQEREFELEEHGLHGHAAPARGRRRLLRPRRPGGQRRRELDARARRVDRGGAVPGMSGITVAPAGVEVLVPADEEVLSGEALAFVALPAPRAGPAAPASCSHGGRQRASTLRTSSTETRAVRDGDWRVAPAPRDLRDRRVEITGPGRPQDDDQRAELGRARLHGRLRGRLLADVGRTSSRGSGTSSTRCDGRSRSRRPRRPTA